ncbi:hypothetical protein [Nitrosomonas sp. Nm34]|uniref:hypothetical protein n=1 Tax=Nitrosomonas sp. Nm34 TaxID=1881055 RepID=UPI0008DEC2C2|nr:hypothetical protein [Nitrosomonas sp. Nm34]SFI76381.1 hypothetical protein SAMN05428978_103327 [Nitrosomonas sp. Nm34]
METEQLPRRTTFEFTGEIRCGVRGEHYYDHCGNFKLVTEDKTNFKWPIYRVVEEQL